MVEVTSPTASAFSSKRQVNTGPGSIPFNLADIIRDQQGVSNYQKALMQANELSNIISAREEGTKRIENLQDFIQSPQVAPRIDVTGTANQNQVGGPEGLQGDQGLEVLFRRGLLSEILKNAGSGTDTARKGGIQVPSQSFEGVTGIPVNDVDPTSVQSAQVSGSSSSLPIKTDFTYPSIPGDPLSGKQVSIKGSSLDEIVNHFGERAALLSLRPAQQNTMNTLAAKWKRDNRDYVVTIESTDEQGNALVILTDPNTGQVVNQATIRVDGTIVKQ